MTSKPSSNNNTPSNAGEIPIDLGNPNTGPAEAEPPDDHRSLVKEIIRNHLPDVSKTLLGITGKTITSYPQFNSSSMPLRVEAAEITNGIAFFVLLTGINLRGRRPGGAKVIEKVGQLLATCAILLRISISLPEGLMWLLLPLAAVSPFLAQLLFEIIGWFGTI